MKETDEDSSRPAELAMESGDGSPVEASAAMDGSPNDGEVEIQAAFPGRNCSSQDGGQQPAAQDQDEGSVGHSACVEKR